MGLEEVLYKHGIKMGIFDKLFGRKRGKEEDAESHVETIAAPTVNHESEQSSTRQFNFSLNIPSSFDNVHMLKFDGEASIYSFSFPRVFLDLNVTGGEPFSSNHEILSDLKKKEEDMKGLEARGKIKIIESEYTIFSGQPTYRSVYEDLSNRYTRHRWYIVTKKHRFSLIATTAERAKSDFDEEELKIYQQNVSDLMNMVKSMRIDEEPIELDEKNLKEMIETIEVYKEDVTAEYDEFKIRCPFCNYELGEIKFNKIFALGSKRFVCKGCGNKVSAMYSNEKLTVSMETLPIGETAETHEYEPIEKKGN